MGVIEKMPNDSRRASVSVAGDGIEIGRLQIHMDKQRTSHIKNTILEARFDEPNALDQTGIGRRETKGWKIVRDSMSGTSLSSVKQPSRTSIGQRKSNLSIGPRTSHLSMNKSKMAMRKSNLRLGDCIEEGDGQEMRPGWRVLRESIKQKEFHDNLTVRQSNLKLHSMDELAFTRHSQLSNSRFSVSSMSPPNRKSAIQHREHDEMPRNKYGYAETNVATHRRKSMAGVRRNSSKELDGDDSDLMQLIRNSREIKEEKEESSKVRSCLC